MVPKFTKSPLNGKTILAVRISIGVRGGLFVFWHQMRTNPQVSTTDVSANSANSIFLLHMDKRPRHHAGYAAIEFKRLKGFCFTRPVSCVQLLDSLNPLDVSVNNLQHHVVLSLNVALVY